MKPLKLFILFLLLNHGCFCQNSRALDSLLKILPTLNEDTLKVKTLHNIYIFYLENQPQAALTYVKTALPLAQKLKWNKGIAFLHEDISKAYAYLGDFPLSLENSLKALEKWEELKSKKGICYSCSQVGTCYSDFGENKKAMEYYMRSLKIAEELNDQYIIANTLNNLASLYDIEGDTLSSITCTKRALEIAEKNNFENVTAITLGNIGNYYSGKGQYDKALEFLFKGVKIDEKLQNKQNIAGWLLNIATVYQLQSDLAAKNGDNDLMIKKNKLAIDLFLKGLNISRETGNAFYEAYILGDLAAIYITFKDYIKAEKNLKQSTDIAISIGANDLLIDNYFRFYNLYKNTNDEAKALENFEKHTKLKDSIFNSENKKVISELRVKYETEKKESENKYLAQQNKILELSVINNKYLTIGLIAILVFILSIGFLVIKQNKLKSQQENVRLEQKLLRTQMNPHFIFNSLTGIESFIYEHQPKEAGNYLSQFARLMRLILENSASEYISLDKEVETLNYYLSLQKLRLNDNLKYNIEVDPSINTRQILIPPMLTQPFLENSIEHGFRGLKECGEIELSFKLKEDYLEIKITDNGVGIVQAQQQKDLYKEHKSMAMQITYERLKFLNKSKKQKLFFSIRELTENDAKKGTEVLFSIPV